MNITQFKHILLDVAKLLKENEKELTAIDSKIGDGDHGVTIVKIANIMEENCKEEQNSLEDLLDDMGYGMMGCSGGSAGPLWGSFFEGLGIGAKGIVEIDPAGIKKMLQEAFVNLDDVSGAVEGDKTMMDSIIPATKAAQDCPGDVAQILRAAADAAKVGAEGTVNYIAKFGRAKNLKEGSLGHKDPGAVSIALFYEGLAQGALL